jgi:acetyl-CoA synthetase
MQMHFSISQPNPPTQPQTRSGKIMRRILHKIAEDEFGNFGDTSTLAEPAMVNDLIDNRQNRRSA